MRKKEVRIHSIQYNFIMNVILKLSQFIFPIITFKYVSQVMGAEANGHVAFASSLISYFSLVASLGIPSYGIRKCAEVRDDQEALTKLVKELLFINSSCVVLTYAVFVTALLIVPRLRSDPWLFVVTSMSIVFNALGMEWFYQAIEQYDYITVRNIAFKIVGILLMFLFIHGPEDYILYAGINVFASVGSNILNFIRIHSYIDLRSKYKYNYRQHIRPALTLFLYNATTTIFTNMDQVMLGFMVGDLQGGYYSAGIKVKNILTSVITALGAVMLPRVSYYLKHEEISRYKELLVKSFDFIFVAAFPMAIYFGVKAEPILIFLSSSEYLAAVPIMQTLMPSLIFIGLSSVTAWQMLIPLGMETYTVLGAVAGAVTDLVLNMLLIPSLKGVGAAIGTVAAEFAVLLVHVIVLRSYIRETFRLKELFIAVGSSLLALGVLLLLDRFSYPTLFFECAYTAIVYFVAYGIFLLLFRESIATEYSARYLGKLRAKMGRKK